MHYTGTIWRPPYEANSLLLEVTAGCTHHRCKFCTLYHDLLFSFRMSPMEDIEQDLAEAQMLIHSPFSRLERLMQGLPPTEVTRVYLVGANPFALSFERLVKISEMISFYFPGCKSIGCFSRITDIGTKTDEQLTELAKRGYNGITIGAETGDDRALEFMEKGYSAQEIIKQSKRLDQSGISYCFFYLAGISGNGRGKEGAVKTAEIFNQTNPKLIGSSMLTVYPESVLYQEILSGNWKEESESEKLEELIVLIERLKIPVYFAALGASNAVPVEGALPKDSQKMILQLKAAIENVGEESLRAYRKNLKHL